MAENKKQVASKPVQKDLPPAVPVHVQCGSFRCLAYRDKDGKWVDYHSREPLLGPVKIVEYNLD